MVKCEDMKLNKADNEKMTYFIDASNKRMQDFNQYSQLSRNMVTGCHNYIDKYLPLFFMRNVREMVDAVQHDIKVKYRLKKYCAAKEDVLTEKILEDTGEADLNQNVTRVRESLRTGFPMPEEEEMRPHLKALAAEKDNGPEFEEFKKALEEGKAAKKRRRQITAESPSHHMRSSKLSSMGEGSPSLTVAEK